MLSSNQEKIMEFFNRKGKEWCLVSEISDETGIHKANALRTLKSLLNFGYIDKTVIGSVNSGKKKRAIMFRKKQEENNGNQSK